MAYYEPTAAWQTSKTNWQAEDIYDLSPDYERLYGNAEYVRGQINCCRAVQTPCEMPQLQESQVVLAPVLTGIESAVANLHNSACPWQPMQKKEYMAGGISWQATDVNRLEAALQTAHESLVREEELLLRLPFILGGELWG